MCGHPVLKETQTLSVSPSPHLGKSLPSEEGREEGENKRDSSLIAIAGRGASDGIKTLPSTRSRQNKYYCMGDGRRSQEC